VPEKVRFGYMPEGRDRGWKSAGTRREVSYTDLRPGSYRFRVSGSHNSTVWNESSASLDFTVAPAYSQTTWFQVSCLAAF
jgi:Y_Y_Y domain